MRVLTTTRRYMLTRAAVGGVLAGLGSQAISPVAARQAALSPVSLQLNWAPNAEHAPYYLGRDLGFYAEAGIELEIKPGEGSVAAAELVSDGDSDFGVATADAVVIARGQGLPVVSVAVLLQQNPTALVSFKEKGILAPEDLYGQRVGIDPGRAAFGTWNAFVTINQLDRSRLEEVAISGPSVPSLLNDEIDAAIVLVTNEVDLLEDDRHELNIIDFDDYGVTSYGEVLFSSETFLAANPELARAFTAATIRSWEYSLKDVDAAIAALAAEVPETDVALETQTWGPIRELALGADGNVPFGTQTLDTWIETYQTFVAGDLVESEYDPADLFSNDFQPAPGATATPTG